jgi:hypothetical protein
MPAQAGIKGRPNASLFWIPAFAGMTMIGISLPKQKTL